jgi:hypothetical protein
LFINQIFLLYYIQILIIEVYLFFIKYIIMARRFSKKRQSASRRATSRRTTSRRRKAMRGGVAFSPASYPVGASWQSGNVDSWAGVVKGATQTGNHLSFRGGMVEPHPESSTNTHGGPIRGGSRRNKHKRSTRKYGRKLRNKVLRGGSRDTLMPQSLVNLGRQLTFGAGDLINSWSGKQPLLSPAPTQQPIANAPELILPKLPDVPSIHAAAGQSVADI